MTNSKQKYPRKIIWGLITCLIVSGVFMSCYGLFDSWCQSRRSENPLAQQSTLDWLARSSYVLYRDLRMKNAPEPMDYTDVFVKPREGCQWVLDEHLRQLWYAESLTTEEMIADGLPLDCGRVYAYLNWLENNLKELESTLPSLNASFGYSCEDIRTGERVGNLDPSQMLPEAQHLYLAFLFDANGNCTVENARMGVDAIEIRKLASQAARMFRLENDGTYVELDQAADVSLSSYMTLSAPTDCRVVYSISEEEWSQLQKGDALYLANNIYYLDDTGYYGYFSCGADSILICLWLFVLFLAVFLPLKENAGNENAGKETAGKEGKVRYSLEFLAVLLYMGLGVGVYLSICMLAALRSGIALSVFRQSMILSGQSETLLLYGVDLLLLTVVFGTAWYIGCSLRELRSLGFRRYFKKRCLTCQFFPYIKTKLRQVYDSFLHFDVTRKANKMILKLVLINAVILFAISSLWVGGFTVALLYSILLYIILRKYISDLQKKYAILLKAIYEIAQGNLNVQIKEDLGIFENFKPQLQRIQQGFRKAVEDETKSQRMRAELITNVSHDLKTPLTAIITYIDLLKDDAATGEQRAEYLDTLERKALRLKALIEDLFEISKADSQNMSLNLMEVDIMNLVKQVAFEMEDKMAQQKLDMRLDLPESRVPLLLDSQRTYRIYENLFGNIAKYAMPGTRVYVSGRVQKDRVIIVLKNITAQEIAVNPQELTERFVRGDASRNTEGSGLGLAIAKSFAQLQGGALEVEVDGDLFKVTTVWKMSVNGLTDSSED